MRHLCRGLPRKRDLPEVSSADDADGFIRRRRFPFLMMNSSDFLITFPSGAVLRVGDGLFRPGTDTLALAEFARIRNGSSLVDLGCGCGALELLLGAQYPSLHITGIECDPAAANYATENTAAAGLSDRTTILCGDFRQPLLPAGCADAVIANPPYFASGTGSRPTQAAARMDGSCTCEELVSAAARLLCNGGRFTLVWRPERVVELFIALRAVGLEPKRIRAARGKQVRFVMIEARRGGHPGLVWEPDLHLQRG